MDKIYIRGGVPLRGEVVISGAKNAALPILASALLAPGASTFRGVPNLVDIKTISNLLRHLGAEVSGGETVRVDTSDVRGFEAPYDLVRTMRASILVLGPLVARYGRARVSLPGGCAIGARPIDTHLAALAALGAEVRLVHGYVEAKSDRLRGGEYTFPVVSVTGTENVLMAAALAAGRSVIRNAAREPEVVDLARALRAMGARIEGAGTDTITVEGVPELRPIEYEMMPDRIEAGTYLTAAAITGGDLRIRGCRPEDLGAVIEVLEMIGTEIRRDGDGLRASGPPRPRPVQVETAPFPGFPTDMQAQLMAVAATADGQSQIRETIFENRFMHVAELRRMGGHVSLRNGRARVRGVPRLSGVAVMATDLRASASLVLAGLAAEGVTEISRVYHLDRGYENLVGKLHRVGADIWRVSERGEGRRRPRRRPPEPSAEGSV